MEKDINTITIYRRVSMKITVLSTILVLALGLSACQNDSELTSPATTSSNEYAAAMILADQLILDNEQLGQVEEMFYLNEDMSILLDDGQHFTFTNMVDGLGMYGPGDMRHRPGAVVDMAALMYFRLIHKACPEIDDEVLVGIRKLIGASNAARVAIIKANQATPNLIPDLLKAEHAQLITDIDALLSEGCLEAIATLKEDIAARRAELRAKWEERRLNAELKFYVKLLELDETQAGLLKDILKKKQEAIAKLREQFKGDPEGFRAALQELMERIDAEIAEILTEEQLAKLNEWRNKKDNRPDPDPDKRLDQQIAQLQKMLGLTDAQAAALKALMQKKAEDEKKAFETLRGDRAALLSALQTINEQYKAGLKDLLTPEQYAKLMKGYRGGRGG
jgi:hypothetical protein